MYGISTARGFVRSKDLARRLGMLPESVDQDRMRHMVAIEEIESRGISYSNQDFDVLSAALSYLEGLQLETVSVAERKYRAICYLDHGQQVTTWLPAGDYHVADTVPVMFEGSAVDAVRLLETSPKTLDGGIVWYVAAAVWEDA